MRATTAGLWVCLRRVSGRGVATAARELRCTCGTRLCFADDWVAAAHAVLQLLMGLRSFPCGTRLLRPWLVGGHCVLELVVHLAELIVFDLPLVLWRVVRDPDVLLCGLGRFLLVATRCR